MLVLAEVAGMVPAERAPELMAGHEAIAAGERPDFVLRSDRRRAWVERIQTLWRGRAASETMSASLVPAGGNCSGRLVRSPTLT